jgi:serine/threonine protein kinase/WD40 repeat protein
MTSVTDSSTLYTRDFRVGDWLARPALNRLERGEARVQVEPKSMEVLVDLAENAGEIRSKRRLLHAVWQDAFVSDDVLSHAIWELRKAFGDDSKNPDYIRTIPRKGYMLIAKVEWPGQSNDSTPDFPYRLGEKLGAGAMGEVYKAEDTRLKRSVALKYLPRELATDQPAKDRFLREARAAAALDHPHIGVVHDVGEGPDGRMYIAMAYYRGKSLKEELAEGPLPVEEAVKFARQIAEGLTAAHERGIVHRDIKPANVMLTEGGQAKVVDFGLARGAGDTTLTTLGSTVGTALYMSPEQARGDEVDPRSDIWSLGVTLFEMVSGKKPFRGGDIQAVLYAVLNEEPVELSSVASDLPPGLETVVHRCLEKDPGERYQQTSNLEEDLAAILAGRRPIRGLGEDQSPYPGLAPFTEETASFFFGRETEVTALWKKLEQRRLLALIGPSGAGKTAFIRAGLIPARPQGWKCLRCSPGSAPFISLGQALAPELAGDPEALRELLRFHTPETAFSMLSSWRQQFARALVVVDQAEELFTLNPPEVQASFAELLGRLSEEADIHVLLSLRDDFLIHCHDHSALSPVFENLTPLTAPHGSALRQAIVEPAAALGYSFEDESIVEEMTSEVEDERGTLPLVAFAAARLWEKRDQTNGTLSRAAYDEIGGVAGALAQHAETTLECIGSERVPLVREIFRNLITSQGTRAARDRIDLLSIFEPATREGADQVLNSLIDARLLTSYEVPARDGETNGHHRVEVIHESLLRAWPRLVRWQTQDQEGAQLRDELRQAAQMWEQHQQSEDLLWTGSTYREYELWRERYSGGLTDSENAFGKAMSRHAEQSKRRRRRGVIGVIITLLTVTGLVIGLWLRSETARKEALAEALRAEAANLLAMAQLSLEDDPTEALAYATTSLELFDVEAARIFVLQALAEGPPAREIDVLDGLRVPSFSPSGDLLAIAGHIEQAQAWSAQGEGPIVLPGHAASIKRPNAAFWSDDEYLVTRDVEGDARVWGMPTGQLLRTIALEPSFVQVRAQDLLRAAVHTENDRTTLRIRSWKHPDAEPVDLGEIDWTALGATDSIFNPAGHGFIYSRGNTLFERPLPIDPAVPDVAIHGGDEDIEHLDTWGRAQGFWSRESTSVFRVWDTTGPRPIPTKVVSKPETLPDSVVPYVIPDSLGRLHLTGHSVGRSLGGLKGRMTVWDPATLPHSQPLELKRRGSWQYAGSGLHPASSWVAVMTRDLTSLTLWPLPERTTSIVDGYGGMRRPLAFGPNGQWLATAWIGEAGRGVLRVWPLPGNDLREIREFDLPERAFALAFDPLGRYVFVASLGGPVTAVPLDERQPLELERFSASTVMNAAAVSPAGGLLAVAFTSGDGEKELRVWNVETGDLQSIPLPEPHTRPEGFTLAECGSGRHWGGWGISNLGFADESTLYSGGAHGILRWNLETDSSETLHENTVGNGTLLSFDRQSGLALFAEAKPGGDCECRVPSLLNPQSGETRPLEDRDSCIPIYSALDLKNGIAVTGHRDGIVRVGRIDGGPPHLLVGHKGPVLSVAISPDLRWIASAGEDDTLRLWPMPDLDTPPLQSLPHDELLAKLRSLTNLRAVEDPESSTGWSIELDTFPGWAEVPTW